MNDAQEWGHLVFAAIDAGSDSETAQRDARILIAQRRRERDPDRRHWGPGDELPLPPPKKVTDLDGAVWLHQKSGQGMYRMSSNDRRKYRNEPRVRRRASVVLPARLRGPVE
ncbi:hypothetical protein [Saccharopolyspora taberi]|uniref:Uncharacterized protein n=1 Tax=Saccharopolyspora taberi TaxID=60895 RepID=A0ABN3V0I0_9PSEU